MEAARSSLLAALVFVALSAILWVFISWRARRARRLSAQAPMRLGGASEWKLMSAAMTRSRVSYRKRDRTLALVTRDEARLVGAAAVGGRSMDVKGQRHVLAYLHPNQRAFLKRRARRSVATELVVDGKQVRAYPPISREDLVRLFPAREGLELIRPPDAGGDTADGFRRAAVIRPPYLVGFPENLFSVGEVVRDEDEALRRIVVSYEMDLQEMENAVKTTAKWIRSEVDDQYHEDLASDLEDEFEAHLEGIRVDTSLGLYDQALQALEFSKLNAEFARDHGLSNASSILKEEDYQEMSDEGRA
jgi:hypothetical protein